MFVVVESYKASEAPWLPSPALSTLGWCISPVAQGNSLSKSLISAAPSSAGRPRKHPSVDRFCPPKFLLRTIYMFFLCRRRLVSQEWKICFVKFQATHTKMCELNVSHPLHTDQHSHSHFCIWIILLNLHLRPFCNVTFGLISNIPNYPALITSIFYKHSSCKCAI